MGEIVQGCIWGIIFVGFLGQALKTKEKWYKYNLLFISAMSFLNFICRFIHGIYKLLV